MASFCYGSSRLSGERGFLSCRVLSSLCHPLLSGLLPTSSNSLYSAIPPQHPGGRLEMAWAVCVDSKLGQLYSSSLPCLSS